MAKNVAIVILGEVKLPVSFPSYYGKLASWLGKKERCVPHICTGVQGEGNESDGSSQEFQSCFSLFAQVTVLTFISAFPQKEFSKFSNSNF